MGDLMRRWAAAVGAQPRRATETNPGAILIAEPKIDALKVTFAPVQSGSGTPSPSNVRPITGHESIAVSIGDNTFTASLGGTYYGGTVDLVSGTMTVEWGAFDLGALTYLTNTDGGGNLYRTTGTRGVLRPADWASGLLEAMCSIYSPHSGDETYRGVYDYAMGTDGTGQFYIYDSSRNGMTAAQFKASVTGISLVYRYINSLTVQLTPQSIAALRGMQTVTSDAGSVEITYYTV